jgi:YidC/Oxa1 family membrane protein insertase
VLRAIETVLGTALSFFYDLVPSFGLAIIFLTIAINLILFPLTLKQTRSTRAFQTIQPEIKRIQKEFKEDPEAMQKELMRVQREAGATPGGCLLPLIVQMPIWFALFRLLTDVSTVANGGSPERGIPLPADGALLGAVQAGETQFLGMNLADLIKDGITGGTVVQAIPYALLIVVMVASQYFQQWHAQRGNTPNLAEMTAQQKQQQQTQQVLTRVMPFFIGFISWNFPAGLGLYWATGNVFRLGQQFAIFAIDGRPTPPSAGGPDKEEVPPTKGPTGPNGSAPAGDGVAKPSRPHPVSDKKRRRRRK